MIPERKIFSIGVAIATVILAVGNWLWPSQTPLTGTTPTPEILLLLGSEPYICLPVKTVLAWTTTPGPSVQTWTPTVAATPSATLTASETLEPTPTRLVTNTPSPTPCLIVGTATVTAEALNVRAGAGTTFPVLRKLSKGQVVSLAFVGPVWAELCGGGWINVNYAKVTPASP